MEELITLSRFSGIFSRAANANEVCRQLVHDPELGRGLIGAQLFALSDRGIFHQVGTYGVEPFDSSTPMSQFEDNPLAKALDQRDLFVTECPTSISDLLMTLEVLPITKDYMPTGAITAVRREPNPGEKFPSLGLKTISNMGGLYLESLGIRNLIREKASSEEDLTERQYEVLLGLARGETNAEIAKHLILSESSIKQETVRIYRSLGVSSREQAVAKARATGMIPDGVVAPQN